MHTYHFHVEGEPDIQIRIRADSRTHAVKKAAAFGFKTQLLLIGPN